jgi:hypothetical protein
VIWVDQVILYLFGFAGDPGMVKAKLLSLGLKLKGLLQIGPGEGKGQRRISFQDEEAANTFMKAMALDITPENSLRRVSRVAQATGTGKGAGQATAKQADLGEVAESFVVFLSGVYGSPYKVKQSLQGAGISLDGLVGQIGRPPKGSGGGAKRQLKFTEHLHTVTFKNYTLIITSSTPIGYTVTMLKCTTLPHTAGDLKSNQSSQKLNLP